MKISCEIIKDLLPLYFDDVCSNDSKTAIEEHLTYCGNCKFEFEAMQISFPLNKPEQNLKQAETVRNLSKRWKKGMMKSLVKGILFTILAIAVLAFVLYVIVDIRAF